MQVSAVVAYAQSESVLHVTWNTTERQQLLSGYRIILASAGKVDVDVRVPQTQTNATFESGGEIRADVLYTVVVTALYDGGAIEAKSTSCRGPATCSGALPCLPSPTLVPTCDCPPMSLHTMGLASSSREWGCRRCVAGLVCLGGAAASTYTAPGWFAVNARVLHEQFKVPFGIDGVEEQEDVLVSANAATERSSMFQCPNADACLGNWSVEAVAIAAKNTSFRTLYGQCAEGYTGVLCAACLEGYARGENFACSKCTMSREDAISIILGSIFALVLVVVCGVVAAKRASRAPLLERLFVRAVQRHGGIHGAIPLLFGDVEGSTTEGGGMSYDNFVAAFRSGGSLALRVPNEVIDKEARALWEKLDEDEDGTTTTEEFIIFFFQMKSGEKSTNPIRRFISGLKSYWWSTRSKTVKSILISHFQLTSSLALSFPGMYLAVHDDSSAESATAFTGMFSSVQHQVQPTFDAVSNLNVQVVDFLGCAVGPRQIQRLGFKTGFLLCLIGLPWIFALLLKLLATTIKALNKPLAKKARATSNFATRLSVRLES